MMSQAQWTADENVAFLSKQSIVASKRFSEIFFQQADVTDLIFGLYMINFCKSITIFGH